MVLLWLNGEDEENATTPGNPKVCAAWREGIRELEVLVGETPWKFESSRPHHLRSHDPDRQV